MRKDEVLGGERARKIVQGYFGKVIQAPLERMPELVQLIAAEIDAAAKKRDQEICANDPRLTALIDAARKNLTGTLVIQGPPLSFLLTVLLSHQNMRAAEVEK